MIIRIQKNSIRFSGRDYWIYLILSSLNGAIFFPLFISCVEFCMWNVIIFRWLYSSFITQISKAIIFWICISNCNHIRHTTYDTRREFKLIKWLETKIGMRMRTRMRTGNQLNDFASQMFHLVLWLGCQYFFFFSRLGKEKYV